MRQVYHLRLFLAIGKHESHDFLQDLVKYVAILISR